MNPQSSFRTGLALAAALAASATLHAAPVIYEPFDIDAATLNGQASGTGLTGNWTASANVALDADSLAYGSPALGTAGKQVRFVSGQTVANAALTKTDPATDISGLLNNGDTLWFSVLHTTINNVGSGNPDTGFAIGTNNLAGTNNVPMGGSGNGFGFSIKNGQLRAAYWSGGTKVQAAGPGLASNTTYLIVGEIKFSADGVSGDTVNIYRPASNLNPGSVVSTINAELNQSLFTRLTFSSKSDNLPNRWDEIRVGASYADVVPIPSDAVAPLLASTVPANNGISDGVLQAVFNEPVSIGTGNIRIYAADNPGTPFTTIAISDKTQVTHNGISTITITPSTGLVSGDVYYVEMDAGVVKDRGGNDFAGFTGDSTWKFTASTPYAIWAATFLPDDVSDPAGDPDMDGLTNLQEFELGLHPLDPDTDNDGLLDGENITVTSEDARYTEWVTAGISHFDNGGQRTFRGEITMGTDPLNSDTDGDGLLDGVETNTGVWVGPHDTGTDPLHPDTDRDGLSDSVETNTGIFVSRTNTGTNPLNPDTDGDGVGDWYEIYASFTDPFDPDDKPNVPYPLPDPDGLPGATDKPVKVYIMSGQSNMVGEGTISGSGDHTLETMTLGQNKFPNLIDETGAWTTREDVHYRGVIKDIAKVRLSPGNLGTFFGPELGFGHIMGWFHDEPVLLLKSSDGNRSLGWDILPRDSPSYPYNGTNYAGYGDFGNWPVGGEPPTSGGWYAGKEFDRFFMDETEWAHPDSAVVNVVDVLDDWVAEYAAPGKPFEGQDFEIAGFVWWQGDKDRYDLAYATRYEQNLVNLINSLRSYYENRYPGEHNERPFGRVAPDAPFVLATLGQTTLDSTNVADKAILDAQLAVDGKFGKYSQFAGNVKTVYSHPLSEGGASNSHYNQRAGTYMLVGDALGRAMVELLESTAPPSGYAAWATGPFSGTLTDPDPAFDFDGGGLATALEWVLGGDPTDVSDDAGLLPTIDNTTDPDGKLLFNFRRSDDSHADENTSITVQYGSDLNGWTAAIHQGTAANQISISSVPDGPGFSKVTVALPAGLADGKLFVRLKVVVAQP